MNARRTRSILAVPVLLLALAGVSACGSDDADATAEDNASQTTPDATSDQQSDQQSDAPTSDGTVELTADATTAGKCAVPSAETLATFDTAFAGTVTSLEDGTATLEVDQWYTGGDAATATVTTPTEDLAALLMAVEFEKGRTYLVSATDGRVTLCGFTGETTPELQALYDEAFAG